MEKIFISEALMYIIGKVLPYVLKPEELFRPKAGSLYVCYSASIYYLYFTEYNESKLIGWLFDVENHFIGTPIVIQAGAECWFGDHAGQSIVNAANYSTILVTDTPDHQRECIKPSDMLDAIKGGKLILAS